MTYQLCSSFHRSDKSSPGLWYVDRTVKSLLSSEKYGFTFPVNGNGAVKNMRHVSTQCEINLLHEVQENVLKYKQPAQTQLLEDKGRYKHTISCYLESIPQYKKQLTYKCIVNNNAENIKAPTTLISLKYSQNWLKVHYNRQAPSSIQQTVTQYITTVNQYITTDSHPVHYNRQSPSTLQQTVSQFNTTDSHPVHYNRQSPSTLQQTVTQFNTSPSSIQQTVTHAALRTATFVRSCFAGKCILAGFTE
jgi:hypothetical protein